MKLNIKSFALSCGIFWGLAIFLLTVFFLVLGYPGKTLGRLGMMYFGYSVTWIGAFLGLIWGFIDGLVCGAFFAWVYNKLTGSSETSAD